MKKLTTVFACVMVLLVGVVLGACTDPYRNVTIEFSSPSLEIVLGVNEDDTTSVLATVSGFPKNASDNIMFSPLVNNVVVTSVSSLGGGRYRAYIKGIQAGTTTIKVTTLEGNKNSFISVTVIEPIQSFALQSSLSPYMLKSAGQSSSKNLYEDNLFVYTPRTTSQKQVQFSLAEQTEGVSLEQGVLTVGADFEGESVLVIATSYFNPDLALEFAVKIIEPIEESDVLVNGFAIGEQSQQLLVANSQEYSSLNLQVQVNTTREVFAELSLANPTLALEGSYQIMKLSTTQLNLFEWDVWMRALGTHQLKLRLFYGGFLYEKVFTGPSLVVSVVNQPTDILINNVSLTETNEYAVFNKYAPLLLGTMFNVSVAPFNVLPLHSAIAINQEGKTAGQAFNGVQVYAEDGTQLWVGSTIISGSNIFIRGGEGQTGIQALQFTCGSVYSLEPAVSRLANFRIYEGIDDISGGGLATLELLAGQNESYNLSFHVYPAISLANAFGATISNANITTNQEFTLGELVVFGESQWRKVNLVVTPKAEGTSRVIVYSNNGYYINFDVEIVTRISAAAFRLASPEENGDVRQREVKSLFQSGLQNLNSAIISSSSTGVSLTLTKYPAQARAAVTYYYCDHIWDSVSSKWVLPDLVNGSLPFTDTSAFIQISSSRIIPTNINGGKTTVRAFVTTTIVGANGAATQVFLSPDGVFFRLEDGKYYDIASGIMANESFPAWYTFSIESFVPISKVVINQTSFNLSSLSSVGYYGEHETKARLSLTIFPSNATHTTNIDWADEKAIKEENGKKLYEFSPGNLIADFQAHRVRTTEAFETVRIVVSVTELDRVFIQHCTITWQNKEMVNNIALHNANTTDGIYIENLPGQSSIFQLFATAYPTSAYNRNLVYRFEPDGTTSSNFVVINPSTGKIEIAQNGSGRGFIVVAPQDRYQNNGGIIAPVATDAFDTTILRIPIIVVDGSVEEFAIRIFDASKFETVRALPSLFYVLCADITLTDFAPIKKFMGSLNGQFTMPIYSDATGTISYQTLTYAIHLQYTSPAVLTAAAVDEDYVGLLFGQVGSTLYEDFAGIGFRATVKNLFVSVVFNFETYNGLANKTVGGMVGKNVGTLQNIKLIKAPNANSVLLMGQVGMLGGIVGQNIGTLQDVSSNIYLSAIGNVGGIVGNNHVFETAITIPPSNPVPVTFTGIVALARNLGSVRGQGIVGGIVAINMGTVQLAFYETIENNANGTEASAVIGLPGSTLTGGVIGSMIGGMVSQSYFTTYKHNRTINQTTFFGDIYAQSGSVGGLIGSLSAGHVEQSFVLASILLTNNSGHLGGLFGRLGNTTLQNQPDVFDVYSMGTYQANNAAALVGYLVAYQSGQIYSSSISRAYSIAMNASEQYLAGVAALQYPTSVNGLENVHLGTEALKTFSQWVDLGWEIAQKSPTASAVWSYGIAVSLQLYPFLTHAAAPIAPDSLNNLQLKTSLTNFVPFKLNESPTYNAALMFYYEPTAGQTLTTQMLTRIAQLNTISLSWLADATSISLGDALSFATAPADASKLLEHYIITSSDPLIVQINNNAAMQVMGVGTATIKITSVLNASASISFEVEVAYPHGSFDLYLGANAQSGTLIRNNNMLKIKRTYSQNITSSYSLVRALEGQSVSFRVEPVTVSYSDTQGMAYNDHINAALRITNSNLGVHTIQAFSPSGSAGFAVVASLDFTRSNFSPEAKTQVAQVLNKLFYVNVWTGAESIGTSQNKFEIEPIIEPMFTFSVVTDALEIIEGDDLGGQIATQDDQTLIVTIVQSHDIPVIFGKPNISRLDFTEDVGNGFSKQYYSIELTYLSEMHKSLITEPMTYQLTIIAKTSANQSVFAVVTVVINPQTLYTIDAEHYYATQSYFNASTGVGEYVFSNDSTNTIAPGVSGLLAIELYPFYANWDSLSITYSQADGKSANFEPLKRLADGTYVSSTSAVYQILPNGIMVERSLPNQSQFDPLVNGQQALGMFYARLLIGSEISRNTIFYVTISVHYEGDIIATRTLKLTAQYLPGATFEIDGVSGDNQLLPRGQNYNLDVILVGNDRLGEIEIIGASENYIKQSGYDPKEAIYRAKISNRALPTPVLDPVTNLPLIDPVTNQGIYKVSMTLTVGALCEQTRDANNYLIDDGIVTISVTTSRTINGQEEKKDSTIKFKVVDYVIEQIYLNNVNNQNTVFETSVEVEKELQFAFAFKGIDSASGYFNYTKQTIDGTIESGTEEEALQELAAIRNNLSKISPKDNLFVVSGNTESSLIVNGSVNNLVSGRFSVREDYEDGVYNGFIITGRNQSTSSLRYKLEVGVPGGVTLVHIFNFSILIGLNADEERPALIYTYNDFVNAVNGGPDNEAQHYILMADITLPADFTAFASTSKIASLDGNSKVISFIGFNIPKSANPNDLKVLKLSLFDVITQGTIIKNLFIDIGSLPVINLEGTPIASLVFAPFANTNSGIITNCHVQNFSAQPFSVSGKGNIQVANANVVSDNIIYLSGFVRTNTETGSITNSSFGGNGALSSPRQSLIRREISIVGKGYIAGFVHENNGRIVASSALNFTIVNSSSSAQNVYSAGFVGNNGGTAQILESQAKDRHAFSQNISHMGIFSMGTRAGFAFSNSGKIQDVLAQFNFTNPSNEIGGYTAGFVYRNLASGNISTSFAKTILNTVLLGQTEFSGINDRAQSLNEGTISLSYYYSRTATGAVLKNEELFKTGAKSIPNDSNAENYLGFNIASNQDNTSSRYGVWKMEGGQINLIDANRQTMSVREAKLDPTDPTKYMLVFIASLPYGTEQNPILIKTADEFNRFISAPTASSMKHLFTQYGTTYINTGVFRLVSDLDFNQLSSSSVDNVKLGTVRLSLVGGGIQGNGFMLKNLDISSNGLPTANRTNLGLFKTLENHAYIKNIGLDVKNVSGNDFERVGVLAGSIIDSYVVNVNIKKTSETSKVIGKNIVGGLAGSVLGRSFIKNVTSDMIVEATHTANMVNSYIANNINITSLSIAGGLVGVNDSSLPLGLINNFEQILVHGNFQVQGMVAGGVIGHSGLNVGMYDIKLEINSNTSFIQRITSTNTLGNGFAGGIVGELRSILNHARIEHAERIQNEIEQGIATYYAQTNSALARGGNEAIFANSKGSVGGLVGIMSNGQIVNSYAKVSVVAPLAKYAGGIVGTTTYTHTEQISGAFVRHDLQDVYAFGDVQANEKAGGIIGNNMAANIRLQSVVALPYLRLKTAHADFKRIVGAGSSFVEVPMTDNSSSVVSVNSVPTGVGSGTVLLQPTVIDEEIFELRSLVPAETNYVNISNTYMKMSDTLWTRSQSQSFPNLAFGVPPENLKFITTTQDFRDIDQNAKGFIYILDPKDGSGNDLSTINWPDEFQLSRFTGTIRSADNRTITITNVKQTMFKRATESRFINFNVQIDASVSTIQDAVFASEIDKCSFTNIGIFGQAGASTGNPFTTIKQTIGNTAGMGVVAQTATSINQFDGLTISNFKLEMPAVTISAKDVSVGGVIGTATGDVAFMRALIINNVRIFNANNIVTPSTISAGLVVGNGSAASIVVDVLPNSAITNVNGEIDLYKDISIRLDTAEGMKGLVSVGSVVGSALNLTLNNVKARAYIALDVVSGLNSHIAVGGLVGRAITSASISNASFSPMQNKRNEMVARISSGQIISFGGAIGLAEGELSMYAVQVNSNLLLESLETGTVKAFAGGLVGRIDSSSKAGNNKMISTSAFTGIMFIKANGNFGGILGGDASNNRAKTHIEFCIVGNGNYLQMPSYGSSTALGYNWDYQSHYYTGTIVLYKTTGETNIGGLVGMFGKIGANDVGSSAERNVLLGELLFPSNNASLLHVGGVVGSAANNYVNENIVLTAIKLINQKANYRVGAIAGFVGSNNWREVSGKLKNIFSHQISLAMQEEQSSNLVNESLYVKRTINERSLLTELNKFVSQSYANNFPFLKYDINSPSQVYGSKLNPVVFSTIPNLLTLQPNSPALLSYYVLNLTESTPRVINSAFINEMQANLLGDGYEIVSSTANIVKTLNGSIAGFKVTGNVGLSEDAITGFLVGTNNGIVMSSYAVGNLHTTKAITGSIGGLVGANNGRIKDSFAHVNINLSEFNAAGKHGGLVGFANAQSSIDRSYSTGVVHLGASYDNVASFVGWAEDSTVHFINCWTSAVVVRANNTILTKPFEENATYSGFNYDSDAIGFMTGSTNEKKDNTNSRMRDHVYSNNTVASSNGFNHGYRTLSGGMYANMPYMASLGNNLNIFNEAEMNVNIKTSALVGLTNRNLYLRLNIVRASAWTPANADTIKLYGLGFTISKINYNSDTNRAGLFGELNNSSIYNLVINLAGTTIRGSHAGAIAGESKSSHYYDCVVKNTQGAGNQETVLTAGIIEGVTSAGGFVGLISSGANTFTNCENKSAKVAHIGNTNMTEAGAGGIVGRVLSSSVNKFINCSNKAEISSKLVVGGIVGLVKFLDTVEFTNCSNSGNQILTQQITLTISETLDTVSLGIEVDTTLGGFGSPPVITGIYNAYRNTSTTTKTYNYRVYHGDMVGKSPDKTANPTSVSGYTVSINIANKAETLRDDYNQFDSSNNSSVTKITYKIYLVYNERHYNVTVVNHFFSES